MDNMGGGVRSRVLVSTRATLEGKAGNRTSVGHWLIPPKVRVRERGTLQEEAIKPRRCFQRREHPARGSDRKGAPLNTKRRSDGPLSRVNLEPSQIVCKGLRLSLRCS